MERRKLGEKSPGERKMNGAIFRNSGSTHTFMKVGDHMMIRS